LYKKNKSNCKYIINPIFLSQDIPIGLFNSIEKYYDKNVFGCPSVSYVNDRLYKVNSYLDVEFVVGIKNNEPYYNYTINDKTLQTTELVHNLIKQVAQVSIVNNVLNFQIISPYAFITDDKDLDVITLRPNIKTKNFKYVSGGLKPYYWIRNLNSAWQLIDNNDIGILNFTLDSPMLNFVFNKSVDLKYIEPNDKIIKYLNQNKFIIGYRKNINKVLPTVLSRRPKKLLWKY